MNIRQGIPQERIKEALSFSYSFFSHLMNEKDFNYYILSISDWEQSFMLDYEDNIKGIYIIGNNQVTDFTDDPQFENLVGIEGVLLAIDESIRGMGWGNKLKDTPKTLGADYIWGQQFKDLNNLNDWLKRRELVVVTEHVYVTVEKYSE
jgi:hypothetical protein